MGQEKELIYNPMELLTELWEWNTLVGAAEGKAAVPWQSPNNTPKTEERTLNPGKVDAPPFPRCNK